MKNFYKNLHLIATILITYSTTMLILWLFTTLENYIDKLNSITGALCCIDLIFTSVGAIFIVYSICHLLWHKMRASINYQKIAQTRTNLQLAGASSIIINEAKTAENNTEDYYNTSSVIAVTIGATFFFIVIGLGSITNHPQIFNICSIVLTCMMFAGWLIAVALFLTEVIIIRFNTRRLKSITG